MGKKFITQFTKFMNIPHSGEYIKTKSRTVPYSPKFSIFAVYLFGKILNKICEPSRGGMGSKLKQNKNILKIMVSLSIPNIYELISSPEAIIVFRNE